MIDRNREDNSSQPISEGSRDVVKKMKEHGLLSLGMREEGSRNKDIYLLAVALGLGSPTKRMIAPQSWARNTYFQMEDKALIQAVLLGSLNSSEDITSHCDLKEAYSYCRQFTDVGFQKIDKFAAEGFNDPDLMVRKMLDYVESKYDEVIKG